MVSGDDRPMLITPAIPSFLSTLARVWAELMAGTESVLRAKQENHMERHAREGKSSHLSWCNTERLTPSFPENRELLLISSCHPGGIGRVIVNDVANLLLN